MAARTIITAFRQASGLAQCAHLHDVGIMPRSLHAAAGVRCEARNASSKMSGSASSDAVLITEAIETKGDRLREWMLPVLPWLAGAAGLATMSSWTLESEYDAKCQEQIAKSAANFKAAACPATTTTSTLASAASSAPSSPSPSSPSPLSPSSSSTAHTTGHAGFKATLAAEVADKDFFSCLLIHGACGSGKSWSVEQILRAAAWHDGVSVVHVKTAAVHTAEGLVDAFEVALGLADICGFRPGPITTTTSCGNLSCSPCRSLR